MGIFLGYPTYSRGYICLNPRTLRIYISSMWCLMSLSFFLYSPLLHPLVLLLIHPHPLIPLLLLIGYLFKQSHFQKAEKETAPNGR